MPDAIACLLPPEGISITVTRDLEEGGSPSRKGHDDGKPPVLAARIHDRLAHGVHQAVTHACIAYELRRR